jgi:50S ribosomal subunit-associated GTPase HflX
LGGVDGVAVLDRQEVILDIFARRAQTREARLQVELAQLEYSLPRLTRAWGHLVRQGGGIGARGEGETQLEQDKRRIRLAIDRCKRELLTGPRSPRHAAQGSQTHPSAELRNRWLHKLGQILSASAG